MKKWVFSSIFICLSSSALALSDTDGDKMPDVWEAGFSLDATNSADATIDSDGDGRSNINEYLHGSNPKVAETSLSPSYFLYWDGIVNGWDDYSPTASWQSHFYASGTLAAQIAQDLTHSGTVYEGQHALKIDPSRWKFLNLQNLNIDTSPFEYLEFYIHGGTTGGQNLKLSTHSSSHTDKTQQAAININDYVDGGSVVANDWKRVRIPLTDIVATESVITRLNIG